MSLQSGEEEGVENLVVSFCEEFLGPELYATTAPFSWESDTLALLRALWLHEQRTRERWTSHNYLEYKGTATELRERFLKRRAVHARDRAMERLVSTVDNAEREYQRVLLAFFQVVCYARRSRPTHFPTTTTTTGSGAFNKYYNTSKAVAPSNRANSCFCDTVLVVAFRAFPRELDVLSATGRNASVYPEARSPNQDQEWDIFFESDGSLPEEFLSRFPFEDSKDAKVLRELLGVGPQNNLFADKALAPVRTNPDFELDIPCEGKPSERSDVVRNLWDLLREISLGIRGLPKDAPSSSSSSTEKGTKQTYFTKQEMTAKISEYRRKLIECSKEGFFVESPFEKEFAETTAQENADSFLSLMLLFSGWDFMLEPTVALFDIKHFREPFRGEPERTTRLPVELQGFRVVPFNRKEFGFNHNLAEPASGDEAVNFQRILDKQLNYREWISLSGWSDVYEQSTGKKVSAKSEELVQTSHFFIFIRSSPMLVLGAPKKVLYNNPGQPPQRVEIIDDLELPVLFEGRVRYELVGVVCYTGGHYYGFYKEPFSTTANDNEWFLYDDLKSDTELVGRGKLREAPQRYRNLVRLEGKLFFYKRKA
jgi:hypothetical protein